LAPQDARLFAHTGLINTDKYRPILRGHAREIDGFNGMLGKSTYMKILNMKTLILTGLCITLLSACSGLRTTEQTYMAHAENFNFLFMQIPGGDSQERAMELVPENATIDTLISTPDDTTSFLGILNRIIGMDYTTINGRINVPERAPETSTEKKLPTGRFSL